jgi:hypothetical protein
MKTAEITPESIPNKADFTAGRKMMTALILFCIFACRAQDNIMLNNGIEIKAKVIEVANDYIKYYKPEEGSHVILSLPTADIFMVKYENGTREVFTSKKTASPPSSVVQVPSVANTAGFDQDSSDFARIRRKKFNGPRIGVTMLSAGTAATYLEEKGKRPLLTQFGWQFEGRLFTVENISGIVELVPMVGGFEQGLFIPSLSALIGIRSGENIPVEFALGPNFSVSADNNGNRKGFAGIVIACGTSLRRGNVYFPINLAFVPSVGYVSEEHDPGTNTISKVKYYSGSRLSLIVGFNSRKK